MINFTNLSLLILNFILPIVMILTGLILKNHPVSDMNSGSGYNTPVSRKSQEHWNYAQHIAPDIYISLGKILFVIEIFLNLALYLFHVSSQITLTVGIGLGLGFLFLGFYKTDSEIKRKFAEK